jgi:hypothetical protein
VKKETTESFVHAVVHDEGVRRACADFVIAIVGALTGKRSVPTTPED